MSDVLSINDPHSPIVLIELIQRLKAQDVMQTDFLTASKSTALKDIQDILKTNNLTGVPITEGKRLLGLVSIEDLMRALEFSYINEPAEKHMTRNLVVLAHDMPLTVVINTFEKYKYNRFPVLNQDKHLVGMITSRDIILGLLSEMNNEVAKLEEMAENKKSPTQKEGTVLKNFPLMQHDFANGGKASTSIKKLLKEKGVTAKIIRRVAVAAYELEINIVAHSLGGELSFMLSPEKMEIIARDVGPGIEDPEWVLKEGNSTATEWIRSLGFGAGMGLPNVKRVSDDFQLKSDPSGTEARATILIPEESVPN